MVLSTNSGSFPSNSHVSATFSILLRFGESWNPTNRFHVCISRTHTHTHGSGVAACGRVLQWEIPANLTQTYTHKRIHMGAVLQRVAECCSAPLPANLTHTYTHKRKHMEAEHTILQSIDVLTHYICNALQHTVTCCNTGSGAHEVCCRVLQCVAVRCSALQCVAMWCSVLQCVAVCRSVLQRVAAFCSVFQCVGTEVEHMPLQSIDIFCPENFEIFECVFFFLVSWQRRAPPTKQYIEIFFLRKMCCTMFKSYLC